MPLVPQRAVLTVVAAIGNGEGSGVLAAPRVVFVAHEDDEEHEAVAPRDARQEREIIEDRRDRESELRRKRSSERRRFRKEEKKETKSEQKLDPLDDVVVASSQKTRELVSLDTRLLLPHQ